MGNRINRTELEAKLRGLEGLSQDEKSALIELLHQKRYGLVWENKPEDVEEKLRMEIPVLKERKELALTEGGADAPNHILIEGDNLEALTALSYTHENAIDVIYIDPPYNTGKEFVYNDSIVDKEDDYRHSKWLSFMAKRLKIAIKLLSDKGVMFISIDDNEMAQLKLLCDEIFNNGSIKNSNCLGVLIWDLGSGTQAGHFTRAHEYILAYARRKELLPNFSGGEGIIDHSALKKISKKNPPVKYTFKAGAEFRAPDGTELVGEWGGSEKTTLIEGRMISDNGKLKYDVTLSAGFAMINQMKSWFDGKHTLDSKGQVVKSFYFNEHGVLHYIKDKSILNPSSVLSEFGATKNGTNQMEELFNQKDIFDYVKPLDLIEFFIKLKGSNTTILDFFAGSGTTLHATMQLNAEDGGKRKCILVTNNENNICEEVTYERNKRVIQGYTTPKGVEVEGLKNNNLRYYKVDSIPRESSITAKREFMKASTDLLCIKNDIYREVEILGEWKMRANVARFFEEGERRMLIIYTEDAFERIVEELKRVEVKEKILVYVFSVNNYAMDADFEEVADKVQLCALPAAIYNAYLKVLPKKRIVKQTTEEENV